MIIEGMTIAMCAGCADWYGSSDNREQLVHELRQRGWQVSEAGHVLCPACAAPEDGDQHAGGDAPSN